MKTTLTQSSRNSNQVLSESQMHLLGLPIGAKVLIELTNPIGKVSTVRIGDEVGFERVASTEFGQITILVNGYTLKLDSGYKEIIKAYEYLQDQVNAGCRVRFALPSDRLTWWAWQEKPWHYGETKEGVKTLFISLLDH